MKRRLLGNLVLKISAVILAVILWLFVVSRGQTELSLDAPLEYANIPQGLEIARHVVKSATVVIRIHESLGKNIRQENVRVYVDVSKARKGEGVFSIKKDDVKLPHAATILKIEPSTIKLVFEETVTKKVTIKPTILGRPEEGYYVKSIETRPRDVVIEGAQSEVRKVGFIKTEPIDITGLTENLSQEVGLDMSELTIRTKIDKADMHIQIMRRGK